MVTLNSGQTLLGILGLTYTKKDLNMSQYSVIGRDELKDLVTKAMENRDRINQKEIDRKVQLICDRENNKFKLLKKLGLFEIVDWLGIDFPRFWTMDNISSYLKYLSVSEMFEYQSAKSQKLVDNLNFLRIYAALLLFGDVIIIDKNDLADIKYWAERTDGE